MNSTQIKDNQAVRAVLTDYLDKKTGQLDTTSTASWSSADTSICAVSLTDPTGNLAADPLQRYAWLVGQKPGTTTIGVTCGGQTLSIMVTVAASGELDVSFDPPVDLPPPPPPAA